VLLGVDFDRGVVAADAAARVRRVRPDGLQADVVVVVPPRQERELAPRLREFEVEDVLVERDGAAEVPDLKMDVPEVE
jgi:hypothetical protein